MDDTFPPLPGSFAEFHARLGGVPLDRILMTPPPGTATEADLLAAWTRQHRCELVDGTLIEKYGSFLGGVIVGEFVGRVSRYTEETDAGVPLMGNLPFRLKPGLIRCPSFTFTAWERIPGEELPDEEIASFVPSLAVEVTNRWVTAAETTRRVGEYFTAGVQLTWVIDPATQTAAVWTSAEQSTVLDETGDLNGGDVLPGFKLPLADLFRVLRRLKHLPR